METWRGAEPELQGRLDADDQPRSRSLAQAQVDPSTAPGRAQRSSGPRQPLRSCPCASLALLSRSPFFPHSRTPRPPFAATIHCASPTASLQSRHDPPRAPAPRPLLEQSRSRPAGTRRPPRPGATRPLSGAQTRRSESRTSSMLDMDSEARTATSRSPVPLLRPHPLPRPRPRPPPPPPSTGPSERPSPSTLPPRPSRPR